MRALAEFVMRGRPQAIGASVICAPLPLLHLLSTSIVSLVLLRKGPSEGLLVLGWTVLPGVPVLSEESTVPDFATRQSWRRYWIIDPLDGTK
ncbi:MAG: hypothetical protein HUJ31_16280, partial [Pseudomonadales bacterium]|nr:hypothetical protein [Pseudomonadales bacterium]